MPGAFQYTGRLQRASVLGGGSAELQRKATRVHRVKEYLEHVDRVHDRMLLMLRSALHNACELDAEGGTLTAIPANPPANMFSQTVKLGGKAS